MLPLDIFNQHTHIGLDLDDTLAATAKHMLSELHERWKFLSIPSIEWLTNFHWYELEWCDMDKEELSMYWKRHHLREILPLENSIDGVFQLQKRNKHLHIITARNEHDHKTDSVSWAQRYFPEIHPSNIQFANHNWDQVHLKSTICKQHNITLMIDDGLHNAIDLAENDITCILIDRPWNQSDILHPKIHRVEGWQTIINNLS